jgi:hypothetical protein
VALLDDLDAFYLEQRRCGELAGGVEGDRVWDGVRPLWGSYGAD